MVRRAAISQQRQLPPDASRERVAVAGAGFEVWEEHCADHGYARRSAELLHGAGEMDGRRQSPSRGRSGFLRSIASITLGGAISAALGGAAG
jgi:hypothetical protein